MLLRWLHLSSCLLVLRLCPPSNALCPSVCTCKVTDRGRRKVLCNQGGITDHIPTSEMDTGTEILEITAPPEAWNSLVITPTFQHLKKLEELHIVRSRVNQIGMHPFWGVPSLKHLDLTFNNIVSVFDHNFRGLVNLVELNLDDNRISGLPTGVFKHLTELRILTLQRNMLHELVPRLFLKLAKLHVLKLSGNKFEELDPEVFKDVPELRVLECRGCGLRRINTLIYHLLPYLAHLDLGNNQMQFISSDEFRDLKHLHTLKLDGNQLPVVLEKTFERQHELKYLCLARNRLAKITNTAFLNLSNLVDLDIGYNKLDRIEMVAFQHVAETLQRLVISGNAFGLSVIKNILITVYNVRDVELAHMNMRHLPKGLLPDRIRKLNVSSNNLTDFGGEVLPRHLAELDLSRNKLVGLEESAVFRMEELQSVSLQGNPWLCTVCNLGMVLTRTNRSAVFRNLTCASPYNLEGRVLSTLQMSDLAECSDLEDENHSFAEGKVSVAVGVTTFLTLLIVCIIFVVCSCMRRRARNSVRGQKRMAEMQENNLDHPIAVFAKGEISFNFPLDLTERKVSVSTIDGIKKDTQTLPNGTGI